MEKNTNDEKEKQERYLRENIERIKHKIIILSGKGGVGKSTVAVNLAYGLAEKVKKVGILDVDIHGPSTAKLLGIEGKVLTSKKKGDRPEPIRVDENLYALTIASLLGSPDDPVIWRGPLKMKLIRQFLQDIQWPPLDYLIVDSPPGTGDEPLSAIQLIGKMDGSVIVSTPQDLSLLDARKTINFSRKVNVPVIGIIQNMTAFKCPYCGQYIDIFEGAGTEKAAKDFGVEILGKIPIDKKIVETGDKGEAYIKNYKESDSAMAMSHIVDKIIERLRLPNP
jgi:Mrp family chromosome partitioning ATPase